MKPELQAYLDGEIAFENLPLELRDEAKRWERLLADVTAIEAVHVPAGSHERVEAELRSRYAQPAWRRGVEWIARPRTLRVSPLAGLAAAAAILLFIFQPWTPTVEPPAPETSRVYVQLMVQAPGARSVAVAGDFTGWSPDLQLDDVDGDGIWTGRIAVTPGVHEYMFVIDGAEWVTDPNAERHVDDGFGNRNAVMVVAPPLARS